MKRLGLVQIYTGDGKGKTTAAVGLAVRANAQGMRVCYMSFHKNPQYYKFGEQKNLKKLGINVRYFAKDHPMCWTDKNASHDELRDDCQKGLKFIEEVFKDKEYDLLIVDELNISVRDGFLKEKEVLAMIDRKPSQMELVITGRGATKKIMEKADLVSYIKAIKHPFKKGVASRRGIEY